MGVRKNKSVSFSRSNRTRTNALRRESNQEPYAAAPHVRFIAGGAESNHCLYRNPSSQFL